MRIVLSLLHFTASAFARLDETVAQAENRIALFKPVLQIIT